VGLKLATTFAIMFLFALVYAVVFAIGIWFLPADLFGLLIMVGFTLLIVLFQYGISPYIIQWIYRIDWIPYETFARQYPHLSEAVDKVAALQGIKHPRMGIIHDGNPNAFTFGHTKNNARIVITDGILQFLDEDEQTAVVAHELGHVVHNDFIIMTVIFAIPLILLTIARWSYYVASFSGRRSGDRDGGGNIALIMLVIAALSFVSYYIGYLISLVVSRIREYYADEHSAELTEDPNTLSTALVKIAYGLLVGGNEAEIRERNKSKVRALRGLGIFDPKKASHLAVEGVGRTGTFSNEAIQKAAGWDLFNPWAKYFQIFSTHPLPAKRIQRLNDQCETYGKSIEIDFSDARKLKQLQVGKSMAGEFLTDVIIKTLPSIIFTLLLIFTGLWIFGYFFLTPFSTLTTLQNLLLLWAVGFVIIGLGYIIRTSYMYRGGFEPKSVLDLVTVINVSPVRPVPAIIEGRIIGKGIPGYYFSDDIFFQDDTGLLYIDYRFGLSIMDFFWAIARVNRLIGQRVRIRGWYRRGPSPYLQIDRLETERGKTYRNYSKHLTYIGAVIFFLIGAVFFYFWFTLAF
jgi:Zn-dependent protease with chaperone function